MECRLNGKPLKEEEKEKELCSEHQKEIKDMFEDFKSWEKTYVEQDVPFKS